jgi:hypothetical protein
MFSKIITGIAFSALCLSGCYGAADVTDETEATAEEASSRSWERLVGSWRASSGPFRAVVFTRTTETRGRHFFADYDRPVVCVRAPCPPVRERVEGAFTATTRTLNLNSSDARLGAIVAPFGQYQYTLSGNTLTLSQNGRVVSRLSKVTSYCTEADDCAEQGLIVPACLGRFTCSPTNTCGYTCGRPVSGAGEFCGGIAGIQCGPGLTCILGGSFPDAGGTCRSTGSTCAVIRCTATTHCEENPAGARCVPNARSCATMECAPGFVCRDTAGVGACIAQNRVCGTAVCSEGTVCCNGLRGICTPPGFACIQ